MRRFGPLALLLLLSLALIGAGPIHPKRPPGFGKGKRAEARSWKTVQHASKRRDAAATLQRSQTYLTGFPEGPHRTEAHLLAGRAALDQDLWPACRHHLDAYLKQGGREDVQRVSFQATLCRAREGKDAGVVTVLRNIVVNSQDELRATKAGRELVAYHLLQEQARPAFEAQALLLERGLYVGARDLRDSRRAARDLGDSVLDAMQKDAGRGLLAGVFAFLKLERSGGLEEGKEGEKARRTFLYGFPEHPLGSLIPDAEELLRHPLLTGPPKVGVLLPLTGRFEVPGNNARRGIFMALADLRDAPDTPLAELELIVFDTEGSAERAVEGARKLASEDGVLAILGPIIGDEAEAVGDIADELRIPIIMNSQRAGVTEGHPTVFNNWVSPEEQVDAALEYITTKMAVDSFAIAYPERETAARMVERFWTGLEERGGRVSFIESYADGTTDFTKVARRFTGRHYYRYPPTEIDYVLPFLPGRSKPQIESMPFRVKPGLDFEAFFVPDHFRAMSMLAPGFVAERINLSSYFGDHRGLPIPIIGGAALNHPSLLQRGKRFAEGILLVDSFFSGSHEDVVQRFVLQYQLLHGSSPAVLEAACYDSARFLFELIERGNLYPEDLVAGLSLTTPSASILRSTGFDASREMGHSMLVLQVRDGAFSQIHPPPPENPVRYEIGEEGILLAFQKDEEGNKVEVAITGGTHLRLPPREESEGEEDEGEEDEGAENEKEEADDSKTAAPRTEENADP
jgi:hypothetical protein